MAIKAREEAVVKAQVNAAAAPAQTPVRAAESKGFLKVKSAFRDMFRL